MQVSDLLDRPLAERLEAMEALWDSLCRDTDFNPSPAWHEDVLVERRRQLDAGDHVPWNEAKARLQATARRQD